MIKRVVKSDLNSGTADDPGFVKPDVARFRSRFTFVRKEKKLRVADANAIAVIEKSCSDWQVVDERTVQAVEIGDDKAVVCFFDLAMFSRY